MHSQLFSVSAKVKFVVSDPPHTDIREALYPDKVAWRSWVRCSEPAPSKGQPWPHTQQAVSRWPQVYARGPFPAPSFYRDDKDSEILGLIRELSGAELKFKTHFHKHRLDSTWRALPKAWIGWGRAPCGSLAAQTLLLLSSYMKPINYFWSHRMNTHTCLTQINAQFTHPFLLLFSSWLC